MIIDVDSHWETTRFAPGEDPLGPWADDLPVGVERLAFGVAGDLLRALPEAHRPTAKQLLPGLVNMAKQRGGPIILHPQHDSTAAERVGCPCSASCCSEEWSVTSGAASARSSRPPIT